MKLCVTGGAGFIGSAFVRRALLDQPPSGCSVVDSVVVLDALTYAGNLENLDAVKGDPRFSFVRGSVCDAATVLDAVDGCDAIVNFAAETHVDRSLHDSGAFVTTNIDGTRVLLEVAAERGLRFAQVSTDEVYGSLGAEGLFREDSPLDPSSPYAASKAAADLLVGAWARSYGVDAVVTRCGNNYGPRQFPEKLIPLFITNALQDERLPLYGDGLNVRDWIHVDDHCDAIRIVLERGLSGSTYNVSAHDERTNREICECLLGELQKSWDLVRFVTDRPGHDRRYALDSTKLREETGWAPKIGFALGMAETVRWYAENKGWWERVRSGEYRDYYDRMYAQRLEDGRTEEGK